MKPKPRGEPGGGLGDDRLPAGHPVGAIQSFEALNGKLNT
jgi:hypothetical protein